MVVCVGGWVGCGFYQMSVQFKTHDVVLLSVHMDDIIMTHLHINGACTQQLSYVFESTPQLHKNYTLTL